MASVWRANNTSEGCGNGDEALDMKRRHNGVVEVNSSDDKGKEEGTKIRATTVYYYVYCWEETPAASTQAEVGLGGRWRQGRGNDESDERRGVIKQRKKGWALGTQLGNGKWTSVRTSFTSWNHSILLFKLAQGLNMRLIENLIANTHKSFVIVSLDPMA
ncbi:hypothetical protein B296_00039634 [Ensete ventricosum]|uniref:Uncharacterized protein n=1 Tax=Ensete ventricosum TaxID=4639 RepID=A0A426ZSX5_ENSVE|nr:hypothetical protein B296_00039634 [Ensete ventricosum]